MSNHVWVSDIRNQEAILGRTACTDITSENRENAIRGLELLKSGKSVPGELCPKRIWGQEVPAGERTITKKLPDVFLAQGFWIVSARVADVIRRFDLGGGALHPVSEGVFLKDNATRVDGDYFCWVFGNKKNTFSAEASRNLEKFAPSGLRWTLPNLPSDDDVVVSDAAMDALDVWIEERLFKGVFLSGPLGDALVAAGLQKALYLYRCRVI